MPSSLGHVLEIKHLCMRYPTSTNWILDGLRRGDAINMFEDVFFTPIHTDVLAMTVHSLLASNAKGVFHVVGDEKLSKHDFAIKLAVQFKLSVTSIQKAKLEEIQLAAIRPRNMALDNQKTRRFLGRKLGSVNEHLEMLHAQETDGRREELLVASAVPPNNQG